VLEGAVVSRIGSGESQTFTKGQMWTEQPHDRHMISRNASATQGGGEGGGDEFCFHDFPFLVIHRAWRRSISQRGSCGSRSFERQPPKVISPSDPQSAWTA
jgi:hypothetical protein